MSEIAITEKSMEALTVEVCALYSQAQQIMLGYAIEIGKRLHIAKEQLDHGAWGQWVEGSLPFSQRTANGYMAVFQEYGGSQMWLFEAESNSQSLANLPYTKALRLLAIPAEEREEFVEANDVEDISTRELEKLISEYKEKNAALEDKAKTAEEALSDADKKAMELEAEAEKWKTQAEKEAARAEELANRPVDVAVEAADPEDIEEEVKKQTAPLEEELRKLKEKLEKAEEKEKKLADKLKEAKEKGDTAAEPFKLAAEDAKKEAEDLRRKLALADPDTQEFKFCFDQAKEALNKALELVGRADDDKAARFRAALGALLDAVGKQVKDA